MVPNITTLMRYYELILSLIHDQAEVFLCVLRVSR